jgi:hypothetical protein
VIPLLHVLETDSAALLMERVHVQTSMQELIAKNALRTISHQHSIAVFVRLPLSLYIYVSISFSLSLLSLTINTDCAPGTTCANNITCDAKGGCTCAPGYALPDCSSCATNYYRSDCSACMSPLSPLPSPATYYLITPSRL